MKFSREKCKVLHLGRNNSSPVCAGGQPAGKQLGRKGSGCPGGHQVEHEGQFSEVPSDWKMRNINPTFKKSENEGPGNCRPISLTSVPSKIMEQPPGNYAKAHGK